MGEDSHDGDDTRCFSAAGDSQSRHPTFPEEVLELDYLFEALAHSRRRYLLYSLLADTEWSLSDLATKIAAWEQEVPASAVQSEDHDAMYVSLYHSHVPLLEELDVIEFSRPAEIIRSGPNAPQVLAALEGVGASVDAGQEAHARSDCDDRPNGEHE